jgi:hypothetical protein
MNKVPAPSETNKSEGWSFDYGFIADLAEECQKIDPDFAPSMEGIDTILKILKDKKFIK